MQIAGIPSMEEEEKDPMPRTDVPKPEASSHAEVDDADAQVEEAR